MEAQNISTQKSSCALSWWIIWPSIITVSDKVPPPTVDAAGGQWWWEVVGSVFFTGRNYWLPSSWLPSCHFPCIKDPTSLYTSSASENDQCFEATAVTLMHHTRVRFCQSLGRLISGVSVVACFFNIKVRKGHFSSFVGKKNKKCCVGWVTTDLNESAADKLRFALQWELTEDNFATLISKKWDSGNTWQST